MQTATTTSVFNLLQLWMLVTPFVRACYFLEGAGISHITKAFYYITAIHNSRGQLLPNLIAICTHLAVSPRCNSR